ncbi:MAG TPA: cupin domain-containing protein [Casimicrobiaceae bacterium]|nr:cupin domain-containing protein [Casimicrobiaceae bacterium]
MKNKRLMTLAMSAALIAAAFLPSIATGKSMVVPKAELKWMDMGIPGVAAAPLSGDMKKGPSRFFLKYPVGFVTPKHHHTADHSVTVVSGSITLTVDGKDHKLGPGSYFELTRKAPHVAKVEGNEEAVFFIQANGPWDVVMAK